MIICYETVRYFGYRGVEVDLILNNIDGEPEVGKEKFAGDMILTLGSSTAIFAANAAALGAKSGLCGNDRARHSR